MIKEITYYKTNDGKEFKYLHEAENHVINQVQEIFDKKLFPLKSGAGTKLIYHSELYKIISTLTVDIPTIIDLHKQLSIVLKDYDEYPIKEL